MKRKSLLSRFFGNTAHPRGFLGRLMLRGMNRFHAPLADWALPMIDWQTDWHVLDVGCGGGANIARMLRLCPAGQVDGLDVSEESVAFARRCNRTELGRRCQVRQGEVKQLPYGEAELNVVTAFETIYFWKDLQAAFGEIRRVLRPGGWLLICCEASDPANTSWTDMIDGMRVYAPEDIEKRLSEAGFEDIQVYRWGKEDVCVIARRA